MPTGPGKADRDHPRSRRSRPSSSSRTPHTWRRRPLLSLCPLRFIFRLLKSSFFGLIIFAAAAAPRLRRPRPPSTSATTPTTTSATITDDTGHHQCVNQSTHLDLQAGGREVAAPRRTPQVTCNSAPYQCSTMYACIAIECAAERESSRSGTHGYVTVAIQKREKEKKRN